MSITVAYKTTYLFCMNHTSAWTGLCYVADTINKYKYNNSL